MWDDIVTPIKGGKLKDYLTKSNYDKKKSDHLLDGFLNGFSIGYQGPTNRRDTSRNLPIHIGSLTEIWNKVMKEVAEHQYAGPFQVPPTEYFIQSSIGLVPKAGGKTRLIFHLSFDFGKEFHQRSVNSHMPDHLCSVAYNDLNHAVNKCLNILKLAGSSDIYYSKTDCSHAFRILPAKINHRKFLTMCAIHPLMGKQYYFIDKCMPFGSSISCVQFQAFSNALKYIIEWKVSFTLQYDIPSAVLNYLDDFLFMAISKLLCDGMMTEFLELCSQIGCPISGDKTEWGTTLIVSLGIFLNGRNNTLSIPVDKRIKAINLIQFAMDNRKVTIHFMQKLTRTLNFLN